MYLVNTGSIQASKNVTEVAKILVEEGIYSSLDRVPIYDSKEIGIEEVYGDIESSLDKVVDKCRALGISLSGEIDYSGDAEGRYVIGQKVEDLSKGEFIIREASVSTLLKELERRGVYLMNETSAKPTLVAYDIKWDTDGDKDTFDNLPSEIKIPEEMVDNEEISDYVSDETGFCHAGFKLGILFRGKIMSYYTNWLDNDTFQMWFGEDILKDREGDSYLIKFEKHLKDNEWVVEIIWEDDCTTINQICNADDYITANEIWKIERICEKMIRPDSDEVPETDGKGNSVVELGKTYQFAGYKWTACELINKGKTLVIQSHGVTHGEWPGYTMPQFGNDDYYEADIDGEDIGAYDDKMQALYDAIKDAEDSSASYGKGLFLIGKGKAGFTKWGQSDFENYWQALKKAAENARPFGSPSYGAWLGTVDGSDYAWYVYSDGNVYYGSSQYGDFVVAPAFNLDLSKVEIVGGEIIIKPKNSQKLEIDKMLTISSLHVSEDTKDLLDQAADDNEEDPMPPVYEKQGYGWFVVCDPDDEETWDNYPADLVQCMKLARDNGCFWLCLDADGPRVETIAESSR